MLPYEGILLSRSQTKAISVILLLFVNPYNDELKTWMDAIYTHNLICLFAREIERLAVAEEDGMGEWDERK